MGRNSVVTENGGVYTIAQGTEEFADYRRWYLNKTKQALVFELYDANISYYLHVIESTGESENKTPSFISTVEPTLCVNRDESEAYILTNSGLDIAIKKVDIATASIVSSNTISTGVVAPLRAIISRDEKIVWLGNNDTLYSMDLDGGNLKSLALAAFDSFALDADGFVYSLSTFNLFKTDIETMTTETTPIGAIEGRRMIDGFALGGNFYALVDNTSIGASNIIAYNITTQALSSVDITALYGVIRGSIAQFNVSGADNFATFSCTIDTKQTVMQCNLDTLECMPARTVDYELRQIEYSNDTSKQIQRIGTDITRASNCDWKGLLTSSKGATGAV